MNQVNRKVRYQLYPSKKQSGRMNEMLRLHQHLYNACLEQRIHVYKDRSINLNYHDQAKEQLSRTPGPLPQLKLAKSQNIFSYRYKYFKIDGYDAQTHIKAEIAV